MLARLAIPRSLPVSAAEKSTVLDRAKEPSPHAQRSFWDAMILAACLMLAFVTLLEESLASVSRHSGRQSLQ